MKKFKVHFIGALRGDQKLYAQIIDVVEKNGYSIVTKHSMTKNPDDVKSETVEESKKYSSRMLSWIKKADIVLVEATRSNFGAGFEIATSLKLGRPVVVIYQDRGDNTPYVLLGEKEDKLIVECYTPTNLQKILRSSLRLAEKYTSERFTLILPSSIIKHLDNVAESGIARSEYIRDLIQQDIKKKSSK